ncbi:glycerate kinase [Bacillus solimangrovi]|uniref:Glycerate kinase n=2 Tax=Bacillus solimangrovi TaxID=1305675 RepID=A0A1E5LG97_9BACI|nr:glycerate kinase [Bacillus solimangrovi]
MNILIAPDSFKGSLSALKASMIMKQAFLDEYEGSHVEIVPMADGGEGTLETLIYATGGKQISIEATGPLGETITTEYGILGDRKTVVIEIAAISGLPLVPKEKRNPHNTTSYGVGEVILAAINEGYREFIIALGGSSTNDGGFGMLQALGVSFLTEEGSPVDQYGRSLQYITQIDWNTINPLVFECTFKIASDVNNPLCGENGASFTFGRQKGATKEQIIQLDQQLLSFSNLVESATGKDVKDHKGAGAAGGLGFAFLHLNGIITSGAELVAKEVNLIPAIKKADWILTGEGQSDRQTLYGKLPYYIAKLAKQEHTPISLVSGSLGDGYEQLFHYFTSCHTITIGPMTLEQCFNQAEELLYHETKNLARLLSVTKKS